MDGKHPTMRNMTYSEGIDRQLLPSSPILFASHTSIFQAPDVYSTSLQGLPSETFPRVNSDDGDDNYYDADGDASGCVLDEDGLLRRIRMNKMRLELLRNKRRNQSGQLNGSQQMQAQEEATHRNNLSIAQAEILKSMLKTMQSCNARGFVYGIISDKGKPFSSASENLRDWWKECVRFECNGPAAAEKYAIEHSASAGSVDQKPS